MPLWDSLSIKQKAAQMVMVYLTSSQFIIENEIGGVLITGQHLRSAKRYLNTMAEIDSGLRIPLVVATDQEGGIVNRLASYSDTWRGVPSALEMRRMDSTDIHSLANKIGSALKELKINMNLAPVLDPSKDSRGKNSFMEESRRSWGNDTTNAFKVRAFVKGMSENGVVCVSKHFPGYDSWTNSDHQIAVSATPRAKIAKNVSFFKTLANDIPVTMMSSVSFVRISSRPAVFEPKIVKMARDMSPETVILTDDLWGVSLRAWISGNERVRSKNYPAKDFKKLDNVKLPEGVTEVYEGSDNSGYVIMMEAKGYGGTIKLICGIRPDGSIEAVKTLSHSETSGIGSKVVDNGSGYHENYKGKTKETYSSVDAVTGATISSTAYKKALSSAFEAYDIVKGAKA